MEKPEYDTHHKALMINLDASKYGTIAEIGAGQEVAHWFFRVGGAAGTVAKTMSAYDMDVSDAIYGKVGRYVSRSRLDSMLAHEYELLLNRLDSVRGENVQFFVFADTISTKSWTGRNEGHGWIGLRFQGTPRGEPNTIVLHVNLRDDSGSVQRHAVGILGVNLIFGAFHYQSSHEQFLRSLLDDLSIDRVEVDYIEMTGPVFRGLEQSAPVLKLLEYGLARAVGYTAEGIPAEPMSFLYKRPVIIQRGTFRTIEHVQRLMITAAQKAFAEESEGSDGREPAVLYEMTSHSAVADEETPSVAELNLRLQALLREERPVLVTTYPEYYHLTRYLRRYTQEPVRFALGISTLLQIFDERFYRHLAGGIVEGMGRLLGAKVKMYVYPMANEDVRSHLAATGISEDSWRIPPEPLLSVDTLEPASTLRHFYAYLRAVRGVVPMQPISE